MTVGWIDDKLFLQGLLWHLSITSKPKLNSKVNFIDLSWSRGSVPSSHARGQRFEPRRWQYFKLLLDPGDFHSNPSGLLSFNKSETVLWTIAIYIGWGMIWFSWLAGLVLARMPLQFWTSPLAPANFEVPITSWHPQSSFYVISGSGTLSLKFLTQALVSVIKQHNPIYLSAWNCF